MARLITEELVEAHFASGGRRLVAPRGEVIVTPNAWARASELGVLIDQTAAATGQAFAAPAPVDDAGGCERIVDPSGLLVVRAKSVRLGKFTGAGANRNIGLKDLITGKDGSPMTAGPHARVLRHLSGRLGRGLFHRPGEDTARRSSLTHPSAAYPFTLPAVSPDTRYFCR